MRTARASRLASASPLLAWLQRETGIPSQGLAIAAASVLGWLVAYQRGAKSLYLMAYAGMVALAVATFLSRRPRGAVAVRSSIPHRVQEGQRIYVTVEVTARRRVSTFLLQEGVPANLAPVFRMPVAATGAGREARETVALDAHPAGRRDAEVTVVGKDTVEGAGQIPARTLLAGPAVRLIRQRNRVGGAVAKVVVGGAERVGQA